MKYIVIGLGNFGSTLAVRLTSMGHEVFGVDFRLEKAEQYKDNITHTICMDTSKPSSMTSLPIKDADMVVVAIGEDVGPSIITTALLKQFHAKKIVARAINQLHRTVLESIGVESIYNPEEIAAEIFAKQLEMKGVVESFDLSNDCSILEIEVPSRYLGRAIADVDFEELYDLKLIGIKHFEQKKNILGLTSQYSTVDHHIKPEHVLNEKDILVMMGEIKNFQKMIGRELR